MACTVLGRSMDISKLQEKPVACTVLGRSTAINFILRRERCHIIRMTLSRKYVPGMTL